MKQLLTDFTSERWKGINMSTIETGLTNRINKTISNEIRLYGELDHPDSDVRSIRLLRATHYIEDLEMVDSKIYGNVTFLNRKDEEFIAIKELYDAGHLMFGIRSIGTTDINKDGSKTINIAEIITWDLIRKQ